MPDKRKKKTREDAIEILKQKAANNGLKNQAQQGARTLKLNTTTEKDNVYTTTKSTSTQTTTPARSGQNNRRPQTVNSSTTPRKSTTGTLTGSQSPSATDRLFKETARRYARGNDITSRRQRYAEQTGNRNVKTTTTPTVRRNTRGQEVSGRDRTRSMTNVPTKKVLKKDTGKWAKNEAWGALTGLNADIASTVDFLLPDVITPKAVQKGLDYYKNANEVQQQKVQALRKNSKTREIIGNIGVNAIQQIPTATMAFLSGGTSLAAQAAPTLLNPSTLTHTGNVVTRALGQVARDTGRNPMFWETFLRTAGNTYDNEVKNGASPVRATLSAYANGLLNAQIEVGGGVELYDPSETFLKAIARSAKEEGLEEVQQYAVENLVNKAIGSNSSKWFSMQRGDNAVINPVDMLEQGAYGAIGGGLAAGGRVAMAKAMSDIADTRYANSLPDIQSHAQNLINRALVQGREGERTSNSERLALTMQEQMDRGMQIPTRQVMELENALRTDEAYNAQDYERRNRERYQQAVSEGRADTVQQQNTAEEYHGFRRRADETMQRNYDLARNTMGVNAPETSVEAVRNVITGSTDNYDIDTVLTDNEAKKAVEKITGVKLSLNNAQARSELENIALTRQIQNRDNILQETHESIRTNMSQRGGKLFDNNYDHAVQTLNVPNGAEIYDSFFSRFYTDGTVKGADFENSYNRIMSNVREDFGDDLAGRIGEVFNRQFAQKVFAEGQMAQATYNAKYQGKALSIKASENPAGFTYEDTARAKISDRQAELLTKFAERANVHIRLVDSIANGSANGAYKDGVIMIAADSTNKLVTVAKHELTHHIRATSPELYQKLEDFVLQKWYDADANAMEAKIQEYQRRYNNKPEEAREELIADAAESFFTDKGSIQAVVDHDRGLAQTIHDGIKTLLDTFLDLQDSDNLSKRGYGDFLDDIGILREAEKMWLDALNDTVEKSREARPSADDYTDANAFDPTDYKFSLVEDKDEIRRLNAEPSQKTYRAMALIDGKLYPPMSTKVKGEDGKWKLNTGLDIGQWIESDITTDHTMFNKEGKFILKKDNGDTIYAAYNPYIHSSDTMLNDQFSTAYKRPNIVVVEGDIPTSELSNGYRAEHDLDNGTHITAKDTTGVIEWKAGIVQGKLTGTRTVYLTQHFKPVRVVPDSEVAKHIQGMVKGTDVVIPYNVVTPNLREELLKLGVDMAQSEDKKYQVDLNTKFSTKEDQDYQENDGIRYSLSSSFEAVGCDIRKENGMIKAFDSDGVEITEFKPSYIRKSPLGRLLSLAVNKKILTDSDVTQQAQFLSRLYNMILNTQDPDLIWAVSGTIGYDPKHGIGKDSDWLKESKSKFASITGNSDPQYDTTIDFTTICVKTQAIIDAMSKLMIDLGRGLTEHEIIDIVYKETARAGEQVPCPVCYVFSRWVGLGNLFGKIKQFQQDYPEDMDMTEVRKEYEKIKKQVDKLVSEQKGKKSGTKAREQLYAETIERKDLLDLKRQMPNKKLTEAEEKELEAINNRLEILDHWSWLEKTRLADDYKAVPDDVLFDLNAGRTFAMDYPATWRFRTTRGPSLGKAVAPYSPSRLGDTIRGIASPSTLGKLGNSNRVFLNKNGLTKTARNAYNKAIENAKRQNRMNGQRLQSTSDFRFEYGLDYLLSFIELEAIGAKAQMYTKVPEAVKFLASTGTEVNCSVMAKGSGVVKNRKVGDHYIGIDIFTGEEIETDQEYSLVFSDITGMSIKDALTLSRAYNNVQPILVGISRAHMIAAMANKYITMIIPFHSSGSSEGRYRSMMEAVGEAVEGRTPFEEYENEHDIENATPEQKLCRKLRVDILTGKFKDTELTDKEQQALKNNEILRQLFIRIYGKDINGQEAKPNKKYVENFDENGNDADCYGVFLTKKQAGVMMPYEYWDKHSTIKDADKQGEAYVKYCESLGITPVFSGWDSKGKYHEDMDFSSYPGYWKTLIDRKMYNNDGTYHKQQAVNVKNVDLDMLDSNAMKDGIFKPMQTQNTEKTQTIVERSKATIAAEEAEGKFQLKDSDSKDTIASQNTIAKLEQNVADLKAEFKRTDLKTADQKQVRIQAGKLIKRHDSNMSIHGELVDTFNKIFRLYKEKGTDALPEAKEIAKDAALMVVDNMYYIHEENKEAKAERESIKAYIRNNPIVVTEEMKRNIADFGDFYKRNFGRIKMRNGLKTNLDKYYYDNLAKEAPSFFKEGYTSPVDMLNHIEDFFDEYDNLYTNYEMSTEEMKDYVGEIATDILFTAYDLQTKKTFADKKYLEKEAAVKKAREKALESRNKALERQKTRYEKQTNALKEELWKANERTAAAKLRGEMDIQRLKQQQAESKEKARERRAESRERTKLLNIARRLDKLKTTAENRAQIDALIGDLDLVAKGMTDKSLEKLTDLQSWYDDRAQNDPDFIPDSNIENKLKRLSKTHIKDMTIEEVRDLYDVLSNIENEIATEKKLIDSEVKKEIYEAGRETIKNINKSHGIANSIRKLDTFFVSGTLSPMRQIRRVTGYVDSDPLYIATKELADGQRKMLQYQMDSWKAFDRFMNDKKFIDSLNGKKAEEIEVTGMKDGEPFDVKITPDIRMAMYLAGMNEDNLRHMMYGGITLPDIKLYKKGKIAEAMESGETVRFSPSQIKEITSHMSKREKEFAQEAYKYYNITSPQAINEVSEVLKGYSLARVNNYFPIHTDSDFLTKEFESMKFDGTIEGMGFLKERVKASNPILMTGLVDTLTKSIEMNSKYVGLAIPVRNFSKILNVKDMSWDEEGNAEFRGAVKRSISKKWGKSVLNYIEKFMTDLQNGRKSSDEWGSVFSKARSRYAGAVLTLNASVAIKQAASYPTAAAVLGWAPLAKAMGNVGKVDLDLIAKYTPLQRYRSKGYSTTELGDITSSRTGNIPTPLNWIQGMDLLTTRKLWKASEYYVKQHNKSLKAGTDEYYKAVAEIYNKVIEETQPNYTTMQRPGLLRSDNEITLTLNMFKTQPYQNFNILFDAFGNYTAKRNQYKANGNSESKKALKEAGRDMQNAVTSQIAQLAVFAAMTSLWALFRRKDDKYRDEEGKLTIFSYMKKLGEDMISNLFAAVPLGADVYSMASSIFTGDTYYGFTSVTDSAITDVMDSFKNGAVAIGDWIEYGRSDNPEKKPSSDMYKETENVISSASRAMGIPASNLRNLVNGIYGWVAISADGEYIGTYEAQKMTFAKGKEMKQNLFRAYQNDKAAYEELRKMMIEDGFDEAKLDDYIKDQRKEHHTEEEQKEIDSTMQELEGSKIWKDATEDEKKDFTNRVTNMALGITNTDTESITKYAKNGLTEEQVILYKLALKKANRENDNNTSYNNDEKEAALRMLEQNYKLTQQQKDILKGKKS